MCPIALAREAGVDGVLESVPGRDGLGDLADGGLVPGARCRRLQAGGGGEVGRGALDAQRPRREVDDGGAVDELAGRKPLERLATLSEWDGFASPGRNPAYARVFEAAGLGSAHDLGSRALRQIAAIRKLRARTNDFEDLVPAVDGIADADRTAILKLLRDRATLPDEEIVPRVKAAMRSAAGMPAHETAFVRKMGGAYAGMPSRAVGKVSQSAPRLGLSDTEITARYAYTTSDSTWGYRPINRALRSENETKKADFADYRDTLNAALAKLPDYDGRVKRRTTLSSTELARYRNSVGKVIAEEAFTSTSHSGRAAFSGPHEFVIRSRHGKLVQPWSAYPGEREVLFALQGAQRPRSGKWQVGDRAGGGRVSDTLTAEEQALLAEIKAEADAWREEDERILAEHGGDPDAANRARGLENQARKWNEEARTSYALREGTENRRVHDRIMGMDPIDRAAEYPWPDEEDVAGGV